MNEAITRYFSEQHTDRSYWRHRNRFYYCYVQSLIDFFVPVDARTLTIDSPLQTLRPAAGAPSDTYHYVVCSDVLGYVADIETTFRDIAPLLDVNGKLIITQYNSFWEPVLRLASFLRLRAPSIEQNWLSPIDLKNVLHLAGFEVIKSGTKMLAPKYVPLVSAFLNKIVVNIFPFSRLGFIHYAIARKVSVAAVRTHTATPPSISIVVPARNEAGTIEKIAHELPALGAYTEIIFIEGNSTDNTLAEIKRVVAAHTNTQNGEGKPTGKVLSYGVQPGKGKGDAVRTGFDMATGDILAIYDADMTVPADEVIKFYRALVDNKGEFMNGSRLVYPMEKQSMRLLNFFGNKFFSFAFSSILGQSLKDTLCGTKVLWRTDYLDIIKNRAFFGNFDPFGDFDLLFGAAKLNLKIVDVPVHYKDRTYGTTNINRWKHGWLLLKMTVFAAKKLKCR